MYCFLNLPNLDQLRYTFLIADDIAGVTSRHELSLVQSRDISTKSENSNSTCEKKDYLLSQYHIKVAINLSHCNHWELFLLDEKEQ